MDQRNVRNQMICKNDQIFFFVHVVFLRSSLSFFLISLNKSFLNANGTRKTTECWTIKKKKKKQHETAFGYYIPGGRMPMGGGGTGGIRIPGGKPRPAGVI